MTRHLLNGLDNRGFALVAVLWLLVLISALAVTVVSGGRAELKLARNVVAAAEARHLADAGVHTAAQELIESAGRQRRCIDGRNYSILTLDGARVDISVRDEAGKIDLNQASRPLLEGLFTAAGAAVAQAGSLASAVLDWRDSDHIARPGGAEDGHYRRAGRDYEAKDAPFESVEELLLVLEMPRGLYERIRDEVTVHSRIATIDPKAASALALASVPGFDIDLTRDYVELRNRLTDCGGLPPPPPMPSAQPFLGPSPGTSFSVVAKVATRGARFQREAVIGLTFRRDEPFRIIGWSVRSQ